MPTTQNQRKPCSLFKQHRLNTVTKAIVVPADSPEDDRRDERDLVDPEDIRDAIIGIILGRCPMRGAR